MVNIRYELLHGEELLALYNDAKDNNLARQLKLYWNQPL
jgi:hypothetical protein